MSNSIAHLNYWSKVCFILITYLGNKNWILQQSSMSFNPHFITYSYVTLGNVSAFSMSQFPWL